MTRLICRLMSERGHGDRAPVLRAGGCYSSAANNGLEKGWQKKLVGFLGSYRQMFDRNLSAASELHLDRGANGFVIDKGGFAPPYVD
jgi:hypothetical protein